MIKITRINNFEYAFGESTPEDIKNVCKALSFSNPNPFAYSQKIEMYNRQQLTFRIGMLSVLKKYVEENRLTISVFDFDYQFPNGIEIDKRLTGKYDYQRQAVEAFFKKRFGIVVVPTRGGKTFIASEIMRIFLMSSNGKALFLTDNTTLFIQAVNDIQTYFEPYGGISVGQIRAGAAIDTSQRIVVGMIQTIQSVFSGRCTDKKKKRELEHYIRNLKFLCVDEIHDNCSDSKLRIYKKAKNLEYQLCLSATPYRENALVQNLKLKAWSGDVIYTITEQELKKRQVLSDYRVYMLFVNHNGQLETVPSDDYAQCLSTYIHNSLQRNQALLAVIAAVRKLKLKTLVLFQSKNHGFQIARQAGELFISGDTSNDERERIKSEFLSGEGGILFASDIFKKGVTLPQVEVLINADGGLESANIIQKKGRVLGTTSCKKRSLVVDFFDLCDNYFSKHSKARLDTYINAVGEECVDILDISVTNWLDIFKQWTTEWFVRDNDCLDTL